METRRDVFQAIADPTRRQIIDLIVSKTQNLNSIAENFDISRQAVSVHVRILTECGLITIEQQGRERYCRPKLEQLDEVNHWISRYKAHWETHLDQLESYLEKIQKNKSYAKKRGKHNRP